MVKIRGPKLQLTLKIASFFKEKKIHVLPIFLLF